MRLLIEGIRTFTQKNDIPLKPLTLLTGENSAGKSTFLAVISALFSSPGFPFQPDFNQPPYALGGYDTIATYKGGKFGRAKRFGMGFDSEAPGERRVFVYAVYENDEGRPELSELEVEARGLRLRLRIVARNTAHHSGEVELEYGGERIAAPIAISRRPSEHSRFVLQNALIEALMPHIRSASREDAKNVAVPIEVIDTLFEISYSLQVDRAVSIAPIRTRPERVYSEPSATFEPGGDHVPYVLDRLIGGFSGRAKADEIKRALLRFGRESGLFSGINIRKLGSKGTDPFQVVLSLAGAIRERNLIDVGYGVSQALPVVTQAVLEGDYQTILMQQPEVHLHPRAQAALGSFFVEVVAAAGRRLIIETHSDFLVDRIRREVANGAISAEDVVILFFDRQGYETTIYPVGVDPAGNVVNAPNHYRDFFLREELALLERAAGAEG